MKLPGKLMLLCCCIAPLYGHAQETGAIESLIKTEKTSGGACCTNGSCCDGSQTPAGVMSDHIHAKGAWMASYTYMNMMMKGNRTGTAKTDDKALYHDNYMMAPETMTMQMQMAMLMYGVTNRLTLMAMGGYTTYKMAMGMEMAMQMPGMAEASMNMSTHTSGLADTKISALYNFSHKETSRFIGGIGVSLPTGTIRAAGTTMLGNDQRVPYDMQPGTGSYSIIPDITWVRQSGNFSYGANAGADIKLNKNTLGYKQGNLYHATAWASYRILPFVSGLLAEGITTDKISGVDSAIAIPTYLQNDPTTNTDHYGGKWGNIYAGLNFHLNQRVLKNFQLQIEYGIPIYENLNGPQMSAHSTMVATLQYKF
jgi:hypothetical protein